jgi:hypothetical protein
LPYVEPLSDARTKLADFFNILPVMSAATIGITAVIDTCGKDASKAFPF